MLLLSSCSYLSSVDISVLLKLSLFFLPVLYSPADMSHLSILLLSCCYCSSSYISLLLPILLLSCWYLCSPADISVVVMILRSVDVWDHRSVGLLDFTFLVKVLSSCFCLLFSSSPHSPVLSAVALLNVRLAVQSVGVSVGWFSRPVPRGSALC